MTTPPKFVDPITDAHLTGIGRVITAWARTERVVMDSLWEIATGRSFDEWGDDASISLAFVTGMDVRVAIGILKSVFAARRPADAEAFAKLADKLADLGKLRNVVAHGRWTEGKRPRSIEAARFITTGSLKVSVHSMGQRRSIRAHRHDHRPGPPVHRVRGHLLGSRLVVAPPEKCRKSS
ncbi:MAG TPA: hypothetical protein VKI44_41455 [Acetobacteraceae bacterium]|nr:hypothetical protein [Acetobacteraceae bacterium]